MDSLTQLALGASIGVAVMGRRTAVWKAALWGGVAGTLPDLDVLVDHGDAVLNMVLHRAESHALLYLAVLSAPLAWGVARLHVEADLFRRWWLALALALLTHPLLDGLTIYGTQLFLPFTNEAFGVGSVFIIDPAYTLPLLVGLACALSRPAWGLRVNGGALVLSTAYLAWSVLAQAWVGVHAQRSLQVAGLPGTQVLVTPAPFSTLLWRVVAMDGPRYHEGFYALADGGRPIRFKAFDSGAALAARHADHPQVQRIARFSDGFYRLREQDGTLWLTDLRMGQEPGYVFHFDIGPPLSAERTDPPPAVQHSLRADVRAGLTWLWARMWGADVEPPGR
ncbi:MAG TPA: metal-dependent hydrolase [Burkholderiaceae bacterium]|nr:metal-dependent hydrolase [Burkholderiaceae bacterium]